MKLGMAFSGGGSRAMAFHRGTLRALFDLGILSDEVISEGKIALSTVSGGSVFGAAWLAARNDGHSTTEFSASLKKELQKGFVWRSLRPRALKIILPGYTRTNVIAKTFDKIFFKGKKLKDLPEEPAICLNTTVLNHGHVGKFTKNGFRSFDLTPPGSDPAVPDYPLSLAVAASAAFPIGLPPIYLKRGKEIPQHWGKEKKLRRHKRIALSDGGILENIGIQTLLRSGKTLKSWDIIACDAGAKLELWNPINFKEYIIGILMGLISAPLLRRLAILMFEKENRHMRQQTYLELEKSWLVCGLKNNEVAESKGMSDFLLMHPNMPRRKLLLIRMNQSWNHFLCNIPKWKLTELRVSYQNQTGNQPPPFPVMTEPDEILKFLDVVLDIPRKAYLTKAKKIFEENAGQQGVKYVNNLKTNFTALSEKKVDALHNHSYWQTLALYAVYW